MLIFQSEESTATLFALCVSLLPGGAGHVESLYLGRSHFSTWIIHSAHLAVSKHIEKPTLLLVKAKEKLILD